MRGILSRTPMKVTALYLDTSVIGGYFDDEWKDATQELWCQMQAGQWRFMTSTVAAEELERAPDHVRDLFLNSFEPDAILDITGEIDELALAYVAHGVVPPKYLDDARHVASCTLARIKYLVSWNFKHLVNVQREAGFNGVNLLQGYSSICIINPLEIIYANQDQNL